MENEIRVGGKPFMKGINDLSFKMLTLPKLQKPALLFWGTQ